MKTSRGRDRQKIQKLKQEIRSALQSYDMRPDVQAVLMFTSRVDCRLCGEGREGAERPSLVVVDVQVAVGGSAWLGVCLQ